MSNGAWRAVWDLQYRNPEDRLRKIAEELRKDPPDRIFLNLLSRAIHPDWPFPVKMGVLRERRGIPLEKPNKTGDYTLFRIEVLGEKVEAALAATEARYSIARSSAAAELRNARQRAKRIADIHESSVETFAFCVKLVGDQTGKPAAMAFEEVWSDVQ